MRLLVLLLFIALTGFLLLAWASHIKHVRERHPSAPLLPHFDPAKPVRWNAQDWHVPVVWQKYEPLVMNL